MVGAQEGGLKTIFYVLMDERAERMRGSCDTELSVAGMSTSM